MLSKNLFALLLLGLASCSIARTATPPAPAPQVGALKLNMSQVDFKGKAVPTNAPRVYWNSYADTAGGAELLGVRLEVWIPQGAGAELRGGGRKAPLASLDPRNPDSVPNEVLLYWRSDASPGDDLYLDLYKGGAKTTLRVTPATGSRFDETQTNVTLSRVGGSKDLLKFKMVGYGLTAFFEIARS